MSTNGLPARLARLETCYGLAGPCPCRAELRVVGFDDDLRPPLPERCARCGRRRFAIVLGERPDGPQ